MMRNLLPLAGSSLVLPSEGVYVGDEVPLVPQKLAERGGYVEMGELLPEFWSAPNEEARKEVKGRRTRKVTDIFTWLQCSASYVAVRVTMTPRLAPELRAYQSTIVRMSQDFVGLAWVRYAAAFRRQAALTGNTRWSVINSTLYTMCFTSQATNTKQCECYITHGGGVCPIDPGVKDCLKAIESVMIALTRKEDSPRPDQTTTQAGSLQEVEQLRLHTPPLQVQPHVQCLQGRPPSQQVHSEEPQRQPSATESSTEPSLLSSSQGPNMIIRAIQ